MYDYNLVQPRELEFIQSHHQQMGTKAQNLICIKH